MRTQRNTWMLACVGAAVCAAPATRGLACDGHPAHGEHQEMVEEIVIAPEHARLHGAGILHVQDVARVGRPRVMIGVSMGPVSEAMAAQLGLDPSGVVMVTDVSEDMPAKAAGVERHDIIVAVDGESPVTDGMLREHVLSKAPGEAVRLRVLRAGKTQEIVVRVKEVEDIDVQIDANVELGDEHPFGVARVPRAPRAETPPSAPRAPEARERAQRERELARTLREHARAEGDRARAVWQEFGQEQRQALAELMEELQGIKVEIDPEAREAIERAMQELQRAMKQNFRFEWDSRDNNAPAIEFFADPDEDDGVVILQEPAPPGQGRWAPRIEGGPQPMIIQRNQELNDRLNSLEDRLDRLEQMLERLLEREGAR